MTTSSEAKALLKILELGERQVEEGRIHNSDEAIANLRHKYQLRRPTDSRGWPLKKGGANSG